MNVFVGQLEMKGDLISLIYTNKVHHLVRSYMHNRGTSPFQFTSPLNYVRGYPIRMRALVIDPSLMPSKTLLPSETGGNRWRNENELISRPCGDKVERGL